MGNRTERAPINGRRRAIKRREQPERRDCLEQDKSLPSLQARKSPTKGKDLHQLEQPNQKLGNQPLATQLDREGKRHSIKSIKLRRTTETHFQSRAYHLRVNGTPPCHAT